MSGIGKSLESLEWFIQTFYAASGSPKFDSINNIDLNIKITSKYYYFLISSMNEIFWYIYVISF